MKGTLFMFTLVCVASGCTSLIKPPAPATDALAVFLVNYGYHTSLMIPVGQRKFDEYAYGDWTWFAEGKKNSPGAIRALFASFKSGLGRRQLQFEAEPTAQIVADTTEAQDVIQLNVPADALARFSSRINQEYESAGVTQSCYNPKNGMTFVPIEEHYWMFHNCNHVTARWLNELGCDVTGMHATSDFRVRKRDLDNVVVARGPATGGAPVRIAPGPSSAPARTGG